MENRSHIPMLLALCGVLGLAIILSYPDDQKKRQKRGLSSVSPAKHFKAARLRRLSRQPSPFEQEKVVLRSSLRRVGADSGGPSKSATAGRQIVPAGSRLQVLVDNECVKTSYRAAISRKVVNTLGLSGLKRQNYPLMVRQDTPLENLVAEATDDECLIGMADDGEVEAGSLYGDPRSDEQKHLANIRVAEAEAFFFESSLTPPSKVVIAIVDTGVDHEHPDLRSRMWTNDEGHHGFDFANDDTDPMDDNEHGTHVAGLAAAAGGNSLGISGVMPKGVEIMAVKTLDDEGSGSYSDVANGIRFAVDNGADLINLSLSGGGSNAGVEEALSHALNNGVVVVVSAGNDDIEIDDDENARTPSSMAKDLDGVISVGAIDASTSEKSPFSNFSTDFVELAAPGSNGILSTLPSDSFGNLNGTSMSAPIVSGAVAIAIRTFKAAGFPFTPAEIEELLHKGSITNPDLEPFFKGGKQLDMEKLSREIRHRVIAPLTGGIEDAF